MFVVMLVEASHLLFGRLLRVEAQHLLWIPIYQGKRSYHFRLNPLSVS
jgi:hypothetical protein